MNIEEFAYLFDGISKGVGPGLKEKEKGELRALVEMFRRFPNQSVTDFINFVDGSFAKERNSVPALVERIESYRKGNGELYQELFASISQVSAPNLKKLLHALGTKPSNTKGQNLQLIQAVLSGGNGHQSDSAPEENHAPQDVSAQVEKAFEAYEAIKKSLRHISIEEMRAKHAELVSDIPEPILVGLLSKIGYSTDESFDDLKQKLLEDLNSLKISIEQRKQIGSY